MVIFPHLLKELFTNAKNMVYKTSPKLNEKINFTIKISSAYGILFLNLFEFSFVLKPKLIEPPIHWKLVKRSIGPL